MKKAQGLSLNMIIVAAIVLIVLVVLWSIFTGKMGNFSSGLKDQDEKSKAKAEEIANMFKNPEDLDPCDYLVDSPCNCGGTICKKGTCLSGICTPQSDD